MRHMKMARCAARTAENGAFSRIGVDTNWKLLDAIWRWHQQFKAVRHG